MSQPPSRATRPDALRILLVAHTHWDREWYHMASRFRQRLVPLVDALLDGELDSRAPFLLDGQAIVLLDYLAVRPEREPLLRARLADGGLEAGPWFVLADNLIPSGEAILRNLEAGARVLSRFGATPLPVLYCPDSFGHPAALPTIAAGYGFPLAIAWRGVGGQHHSAEDTLSWTGLDGSTIVLHHLPPDGYETGSSLPTDADAARERWSRLLDSLVRRNRTGVVLLPSGADHHARQPDVGSAISAAEHALTQLGAGAIIRRAGMRDATGDIMRAALSLKALDALPALRGELRDSYGYTWALQGTFATRAHQKRRNAGLERALLRDVEPWLALEWLHRPERATSITSADGRITAFALPALLHHAWETLLRTHPHDTLCGCSADSVARAMDARQESVHTQVRGLRRAALESVLGHDVVRARSDAPADGPPVVLRNRVTRARGGIAMVLVRDKVADVAVGPGSGAAGAAVPKPVAQASALPHLQPLRSRMAHDRRESPQHYPDDDLVVETRVLQWVDPVPALGITVLNGAGHAADGRSSRTPLTKPPTAVRLTEHESTIVLDNGIARVVATTDGVSLHAGERVLHDLLRLVSVRDEGDSYTPSLRGEPRVLHVLRVRAGERGPLRASVILDWELRERNRPLAAPDVPRMTRRGMGAVARAVVQVQTELSLSAGATTLACDVTVLNRMRDHRLQLSFQTDVGATANVWADAAFGPVPRPEIIAPAHSAEQPPTTMPMHRWAAIADDMRGATLISDGLAEVEARDGRLAITLLRAIGELSRNDLPERPGHAGWPLRTPMAQCQGRYRARVALVLHGAWSNSVVEAVENAADDFLLPLVGETWRDLDHRERAIPGPVLEGPGLRMSAVTLASDASSILLRAVNVLDEQANGAWLLPHDGPWIATPVRLDESPDGAPTRVGRRVEFTTRARGVSTIRIERVDG